MILLKNEPTSMVLGCTKSDGKLCNLNLLLFVYGITEEGSFLICIMVSSRTKSYRILVNLNILLYVYGTLKNEPTSKV